jgi:filamentous hemagglutinin family protein
MGVAGLEEYMMKQGNRAKVPQLKALVVAVHAAWAGLAWALPQDANVVNGQVTITQPSAGAMNINASNGAIINWRQFSIGSGETARFIQPSAASAVLNRVTGRDASHLLGQLQANGKVFLINPNGIVIGGGARIDTNSFVASTLDIADADFIAGKLRFFDAGRAGGIQNAGVITTAPGGRVVLIAPTIENSGIIHAPDGKILLAAGHKLEVASLDLDGIRFEIQAPSDSVLNLGQLLADNGAVSAFASTVRQSGVVRADRLALDADGSIVLAGSAEVTLTAGSVTQANGTNGAGGNILVQSSDGTTRVAGTVSAQGAAGAGGDIRVLGERVALQAGATLDASGAAGGGQIRVGGDYQGANAAVQNAQRVSVAEGAVLRADATVQGDGGRVIVWADENTRYQGALSARGAGAGGDGGFAEVSGKQNLEFTGTADLGAADGARGTLLLDPLDIIISVTSGILPSVVDEFDDFKHNVVTISPVTLAALQADVTLQAHRDIYIKDALTLTTAGASVTMEAGGVAHDQGGIYNNAGITTVGGAVTLRGQFISGDGGITTAGGAVDLEVTGSLYYSGPIDTSGGNVRLAAPSLDGDSGYVSSAQVNAGSGSITVEAGNGISGGSYTTTGSASFTATDGGISLYDVDAARVVLNAKSYIDAYLSVTERIDAASTQGSVELQNASDGALMLGTITSTNSVNLSSSTGMVMAEGGVLSAPYLSLSLYGSTVSAGTAGAPLRVAALPQSSDPRVQLYGVDAPVHLAFAAGTSVGGLYLDGSVAGLSGSTINGGDNLAAFNLSTASGMLVMSAATTGGLAQGLQVNVRDTGLHVTSLALPGANAQLTAAGGITVESMSGGGLSIQAQGPVTIGGAATTGSSGIYVVADQCQSNYYSACAASSPITAGSLVTTGGGDIGLYTYDNGAITVTTMTSSDAVTVRAGNVYGYTYSQQATTNGVSLGSVTATNGANITNTGHGNVVVGSLQTGQSATVNAGSTFYPDYTYVQARTTNQIEVQVAGTGAAGDLSVRNTGTGSILLGGVVDRSLSGDITLRADNGSVMASGNLLARDSVSVTATMGAVSLADVLSSSSSITVNAGTSVLVGNLQAGSVSSSSAVNITAGTDLRFASITSTGFNSNSGTVTLQSTAGIIETTLDNTGWDILATGNVTLRANGPAAGSIGNAAFTNPLDIRTGTNGVVTLSAGNNIGAAGHAVQVDTGGTIDATSAAGQFHVAATDGSAERSVATIRLAASAAGVGDGNTATFTSANLDVTAASDGSALTIGDVQQASGTLNEFSFTASGSSLLFGDVNLASGGINKLVLASDGLLQQTGGNILAGNLSLDAGGGDVVVGGNITSASTVVASPGRNNILDIRGVNITTGDLSAQAIMVEGSGDVALGAVTSTGTQRGFGFTGYDSLAQVYPLDELRVTAGGNLQTSGNVNSATSAFLTAGGSVGLAGGSGTASVGSYSGSYYTDRLELRAGTAPGGAVAAGNLAGRAITLSGHDIDVGALAANSTVSVTGTDLSTGAITAGSHVSMDGISLSTGAITAPTVNLRGETFATGNLTASSSLTINALGGYAPSGIALQSGSTNITAVGDIAILANNNATLTSGTVTLNAGGNVSARLAGTSNLTINTGMGFDVVTDTWLNNLNITAHWDLATAMGSVGAVARSVTSATSPSDTQRFSYGFDGPLLMTVYSDASTAAGKTWNLTYYDTSPTAVTASPTPSSADSVDLDINHLGHGNISINFAGDTVIGRTDASVGDTASGSSSTLTLQTGGTVRLDSVSTHRGNLDVWSRNGDVLVGDISTSFANGAGNVTLWASGSIESDGSPSAGIEAAQLNAGPTPAGNVSLTAGNSIGALGAIQLAYTDFLTLSAPNTIAVDVTAGDLYGLYLTTSGSGTGAVQVTNANFGGLVPITRNNGNLVLGPVAPANVVADFALYSTSGSIVVNGNISNVGSLRLDTLGASDADVLVQADSGPRSVSANFVDLHASRDIVIAAGAAAGSNVSVNALNSFSHMTLTAGRDLLVTANGGSATLDKASSGYTQSFNIGRDFRVTGGSAGVANATATVSTTGNQSFNVGGDFVIQAGTSDGASASVTAGQTQSVGTIHDLSVLGGGTGAQATLQAGNSQSFSNTRGTVTVAGGAGSGATARIEALAGSQTMGDFSYGTVTGVLVQGGAGDGATAAIRSSSTQTLYAKGSFTVAGGSGVGADAELRSTGGNQNIGSNYTYYLNGGSNTEDITVQGGAGGSARIMAQSGQTIQAGGNISVLGGSGAQTSARIETATGSQTIGDTAEYFYYDATGNILVQGGTGTDAFAAIVANSSQNILAGGDVSVLGGGGGAAYAEIRSISSSQTIGNTSTSSNDPTGHMTVRGGSGSGSYARIQAQGNQTLRMGGDFTVEGGSGDSATAAVESVAGVQTIGVTSGFSNDSTGSMAVRGGNGANASAWIRAASNQTFNIGNIVVVAGGAGQGAFAEIASTSGGQTLNNTNGGEGTGRGVTVVGGSQQGAYAQLRSGTSQLFNTTGDIVLQGGTGDNAGALAESQTGQTAFAGGALRITGGTGNNNVTGLDNMASGNQTITATGDIVILAGGAGSDAGIVHIGGGLQSITSYNGSLSVLAAASAGADAVAMIEAGSGGQILSFYSGSITVDNAGAQSAHILSDGDQTINARALSIAVSSATGNASALVGSAGDLSLTLHGVDNTPGSATLSVINRSGASGSLAALQSGGDMDIQMNYDTAGQVQIGAADALGRSVISSARKLTMVAGSLLMQGGVAAGSDAELLSAQEDPTDGIMVLSTLFGPVEMLGGAGGGAFIDPPELYIASNGSVLMTAGSGADADANINAGLFDLTATTGDLILTNSTTSPATASITSGSFNYFGANIVNLNGGTIMVTDQGSITTVGDCINCDFTHLIPIASFNVRQNVPNVPPPPPSVDPGPVVPPPAVDPEPFDPTLVDSLVEVLLDVYVGTPLSLAELADTNSGPYAGLQDETGTGLRSRQRLNQCN